MHHRSRSVRAVLSVSERVLTRRTSALAAVSGSEEADLRTVSKRLPSGGCARAGGECRRGPAAAPVDTVVAVGRLTYQKAPDTVLDLPRRLSREGQGVRCVWVGDGDARGSAPSWRRTTFAWRGWVDSSEVGRLLRCAVVLLHPARYEGFSLAIVEALSHGTPVVARQIPANEEFGGVHLFTTTDEAVALLHQLVAERDVWEVLVSSDGLWYRRARTARAQRDALGELYGEHVAHDRSAGQHRPALREHPADVPGGEGDPLGLRAERGGSGSCCSWPTAPFPTWRSASPGSVTPG